MDADVAEFTERKAAGNAGGPCAEKKGGDDEKQQDDALDETADSVAADEGEAKYKYRCRWDLFSDCIVEGAAHTNAWVDKQNFVNGQKNREKIQHDAQRKEFFKLVGKQVCVLSISNFSVFNGEFPN